VNGSVVTAVHERPYYSLIADGVHVHPYAVNIAYETHPSGLVLVTDAMAAMGLPARGGSETLKLGDMDVAIFAGRADGGRFEGAHCVLAADHRRLAGAIVPLDQCARNLLAFTRCALTEAVASVTAHPAEVLRLGGTVGSLERGAWADICVIDDGFNVLQTWLGGCLVHSVAWGEGEGEEAEAAAATVG